MKDEEKAEEYADWFWGASPSERRAIKQAYLAGLKAGKDISEYDREHDDYEFTEVYTKVEQLEKENAELKEKLETTEKTRDYWKDSSFDWRHKCTSGKPFRAAVKAQRQLTKAKELIEELSSSLSVVGECEEEECELLNRAEQFLSEVEK